ncbi:MAG: glucokinase [Bacteroidetes bacterium GWF2_49_14]|nr:MAG: glucokinase [Bacteroidetes bacterium GWF2_49_14]HBB90881.1 glucokinase [Bacteroidales bacterium]
MKEVTIGIDIGGTNTKIGVVDRDARILAQGKVLTATYKKAEDFVEAVHREIQSLLRDSGDVELKAIGIGAPNGNYCKGTIEHAPNLNWKGIVPLAKLFGKYYPVPVVLTNDANAAALGEMIYGGAKGMKNFIILTLGTGLGSGIVINGELVYGHTGFAGEMGHLTMEPFGRECGCGRQGCLEAYVSATGIVKTVLELFAERRDPSPLRKIPADELTSKDIAEAANNGDQIALAAFEQTAEMLATAINNAAAFCSPEAVFLFGGLAQSGDLLLDPLSRFVDENIMGYYRKSLKIIPSSLKEADAAILGASGLAWNQIK